MRVTVDTASIDGYLTFLAVKSLPTYRVRGHELEFPDEYANRIGVAPAKPTTIDYQPPAWLFDYQRAIAKMAITKRKFCIFADCGLGKTNVFLEWSRVVADELRGDRCVLIISPLMVVKQTIAEAAKFFPNLEIDRIQSSDLQPWLKHGGKIGITNYEALTHHVDAGRLGALVVDESSMLKSHYGKWRTEILKLGRGLDWKMACTGTPAPNDRIEYANHAVFMDTYPTVNGFLATFFVNRGQTQERWVLKPHALRPFYRALSHWSIFLVNPATYGWHDHANDIPPIIVHEHDVPLEKEQAELAFEQTGNLFAHETGGIVNRSVLSQIAKGHHKGKRIATRKPRFIHNLIDSWPDESTLVWCRFNPEQDLLEREMPDAAGIRGATDFDEREKIISAFKAGEIKTLISKPKVLGFGLNLQVATRQVFSDCADSYESYYQAVKRSNRVGSTRPLNVHLPVTDIERPMMENVLRKARMVQADSEEQERIFKESWQC